jgi:hypothetical protein
MDADATIEVFLRRRRGCVSPARMTLPGCLLFGLDQLTSCAAQPESRPDHAGTGPWLVWRSAISEPSRHYE